jgi:transposase InsO family protein
MSDQHRQRRERGAQFRFAVVGPLLASPPPTGELQEAIRALARMTWRHPTTGEDIQFGFSTIERWYLRARKATRDPMAVLVRRVRRDIGQQRTLEPRLIETLQAQWQAHKPWTYKLHYDNLAVLVAQDPGLGPLPSYSTVLRYMKANGLLRRKRLGPIGSPGAQRAEARIDAREVRSYEVEYPNSLWHFDFHTASRPVLLPNGRRHTPFLLGILDDHSRVCCHAQWYLHENVECLVHGLCQGFQKRRIPRSAMSDNGDAMIASETVEGLARLAIIHSTTLPRSPYQNGKQEVFWSRVEGRLIAMLDGEPELSLRLLNTATQAWVEQEYNRTRHDEIGCAPIERFLAGRDVGRPCPSSAELRLAFTTEIRRTQRKSDGTVTVGGVRYEVPSRFRHFGTLALRHARWDKSVLHLVDDRTGVLLDRAYPLDKAANADRVRRSLAPVVPLAPDQALAEPAGMAPLLRQLMAENAASGLPPAYLPKDEDSDFDPDTSTQPEPEPVEDPS